MNIRLMIVVSSLLLIAACDEEQPPPSVTFLIENPNALEAAIVRCNVDRERSRYEPECVNAREAVLLTEAIETRASKKQLEEQSERKLRALRAQQDSADLARLRAAEKERLRKEAEYLAQFKEPAANSDEQSADDVEIVPIEENPDGG